MPVKPTYLFIDGGHLQRYYTETVREWFGNDGEIDFLKVKNSSGAYKCFYYDCQDELRRPNEMQYEYDLRLERQKEFFNRIREVPGCHVRLGNLVGSAEKKKRQKGVDILLAVDMMNHAIRKNMAKAVLLTGDQDFKPLVESLVQMGIFVEVVGDVRHTSQDLIRAADSHKKLTLLDYFAFSSAAIQARHSLPSQMTVVYSEQEQRKDKLVLSGKISGDRIEIYQFSPNIFQGFRIQSNSENADVVTSRKLERVKLFFKLMFGDIQWLEPQRRCCVKGRGGGTSASLDA